jgi:hypothetical protein
MTAKAYKYKTLILTALVALGCGSALGQDVSVTVSNPASGNAVVKASVNTKSIVAKANVLSKNLELTLGDLGTDISSEVADLAPKIVASATSMLSDIKVDVNTDSAGFSNSGDAQGFRSEKSKSYSKSYPLDGNDRIKLVNQYGRIQVNTWDQHQIKVDVQIKVQAEDDATAQKLLDGVQIHDSKDGDDVTFRTEIERFGSSWKLFNFGNNDKHKVEINYTVYMPAKNDLDVENSYGAINLPDLSGKVKISCSYGAVSAQNLNGPSNEIEGSYGSVKAGWVSGAKLDYSYGNVELDGCNTLKADMSYGSFKLHKLTGTGEFDISYVGGFKIEELSDSFKRLKVDASYSGVAVGTDGAGSFNFDITTTYGGFDYNPSKTTITSKNPPDGSKHIGPTRNYKGHTGRDGSDASVNIHTSYGGVDFN